nr:MAG TPA: Major capsid protein [Microviridae sp.]
MKVTIGKNTLGGGKKMMTRLNNYNRSTHDLSFVMRTSMAPGVLVPTLKLLMLPGDTFDIETRCHTLTHPTIGPLFGSFKQQNDFFFCPIRLYNAMLHNNALNIGLNMKNVRLPVLEFPGALLDQSSEMPGSGGTLKRHINPSSLLSYLGLKDCMPSDLDPKDTTFNGTPIAAYFDIFKNYYANKQEEKFYTIGGINEIPWTNETSEDETMFYASVVDSGSTWSYFPLSQQFGEIDYVSSVASTGPIGFAIGINKTPKEDWIINGKIGIQTYNGTKNIILQGSISQLINAGILKQIKAEPEPGIKTISLYAITETLKTPQVGKTVNVYNGIFVNTENNVYNSYNLSEIDDMRMNILEIGRAGTYFFHNDNFVQDIVKIFPGSDGSNYPACCMPMVGLALKTYQSDINTNWVNTEWIDGDRGINAITAIDTSGGSFTLDTLNLAKKVYTMLNRIAVSDGSYNAWIQTVYTSGGLNHIETPIYLGGSSLEIEFQEVINNSGTEDQPLGSLAGRGIASNHKGGFVKFKADEPGYLMCITSITPRVDYFQGNDWDLYIKTLDDLHKPQLDGIGFQDRLYRNINAGVNNFLDLDKSIGKQPAWIEYMTNVNKTYGNFALIENEGWMCLNRIFGEIDTYTTYIYPHLYNTIFADTDMSAQNFWVQIAFNIKARRVMSAKVIPNI